MVIPVVPMSITPEFKEGRGVVSVIVWLVMPNWIRSPDWAEVIQKARLPEVPEPWEAPPSLLLTVYVVAKQGRA